jgi:hypothetical protein
MTPETIPFTFRIDAQLKRELDVQAAADFRSTSSLLNSIIARHLARPAGQHPLQIVHASHLPEPAAEVVYTKPKGRPRTRRDMGPMMPAFMQWLNKQPDREMIRPEDVVTGMTWHHDATESVKMTGARNYLAQAGYEPLIAHYPDGSEAEIWRISPENAVTV